MSAVPIRSSESSANALISPSSHSHYGNHQSDPAGAIYLVYLGARAENAQRLVERGILPKATYVLPDGTPMVPFDHAALLEDADGDPLLVAELFRERFVAAGGRTSDVEDELAAWLSGQYGACLHTASPEAIVAKDALMRAIGSLLAAPSPLDPRWRAALKGSVDALDALERPFAAFDRQRFGGTSSRDRLITHTRRRYPDVWPNH